MFMYSHTKDTAAELLSRQQCINAQVNFKPSGRKNSLGSLIFLH